MASTQSLRVEKKKADFLTKLKEEGATVNDAMKAASMTAQRYYAYRKKDEAFREAVDEILLGQPTQAELNLAQRKTDILGALQTHRGILSPALKQCSTLHAIYYQMRQADPEFAAACDLIKEEAIDFAEGELFKQIERGNHVSTIFYLKTQAKHRGYTEGPQVNVEVNPVQIRVIEPYVDPLADVELKELPQGVMEAEYTVIEPVAEAV